VAISHAFRFSVDQYNRAMIINNETESKLLTVTDARYDEAEDCGNDRAGSSCLQPLRSAGAQALDERGSTNGNFRRCCFGMDVFPRSGRRSGGRIGVIATIENAG
jgi:hypothetical protein